MQRIIPGRSLRCTLLIEVALLALLFTPPARAQYVPIPNYAGVGAGQQFRNDVNNHLSGVTPISPRLVSIPFAVLNGTPENDGQVYWCRDCSQAPICTNGGTGAVAVGASGQWTCVLGPATLSGPPSGPASNDLSGSYPNPRVNTVLGGQTPVTTNNGVNALRAATATYSMNGNRLTNVGADTTTGDALSRAQSSLSSLTPPSSTFNMNSQTLESVAAATASGEPIIAGVTNAVATTTYLAANNRINPVATYGAKPDAIVCSNGASISGSTLTISGCANFPGFSPTDTGKYIAVSGAGTSGFAYQGTLTYASAITATLSGSPGAVSNKAFVYGTDNTTPLQNAETACEQQGATVVNIPPGEYISGNVQLGNPATSATVGSASQAPGCRGTVGGGRFSTMVLVKPGAIAFQRHNQAGVTIHGIDFDGALEDGIVGDNALGGLDMSWYGGAPSTSNNVSDIEARYFNGIGIDLFLNNDANLGQLWSTPDWGTGQSLTAAISTCTESTTAVCGTGLTATCNITSNPFVLGEWVNVGGNSVGGYNQSSAVPLIAATTSSISYCAYTGGLGTGNGGTAGLVPITIDARGPGGQMEVHNFISSGQPGLMVIAAENWRLSDFGIYGGLQIQPIDDNAGELDTGQLLEGDSSNSQIMIEAPLGGVNNASAKSLVVKNVLVAGPGSGTSTLFDGRFWSGVRWSGGLISGLSGAMNFFNTIQNAGGNDWWPHFDFDGVALQAANFNPPSNIEWSVKGSCEASSTLTGASIIGTPLTCAGATQMNMESAYSAAGTPVPGPGGGACSAILDSRPPICALDTSTTGCTAGTAYLSGGTVRCRMACVGTTWEDTGAPC